MSPSGAHVGSAKGQFPFFLSLPPLLATLCRTIGRDKYKFLSIVMVATGREGADHDAALLLRIPVSIGAELTLFSTTDTRRDKDCAGDEEDYERRRTDGS